MLVYCSPLEFSYHLLVGLHFYLCVVAKYFTLQEGSDFSDLMPSAGKF